MSKEAWLFISGGLFYIVFGIYFVFEFLKNKIGKKKVDKAYEDEEWLPIVDEDGKIVGKAPRSVCHGGELLLHPVVHLHVFNPKGYLFLQKRPMNKDIQPGKWDTAVGGHISFGEEIGTALKREAYEEIGIKDFKARHILHYIWESDVEREMIYSFVTYDYKGINIHSDEVEEGKFWSPSQIAKNMGKGIFTPNFEHEYGVLIKAIKVSNASVNKVKRS
jgi:isopentenyldiphosphate isomerase